MTDLCRICQVAFEPGTPKVTNDRLKRGNFAHVGCLDKERRSGIVIDERSVRRDVQDERVHMTGCSGQHVDGSCVIHE